MPAYIRALASLALAFGVAGSALAQPPALTDAWIRATPPGARTAAAYLAIASGGTADRLLGAETEAARSVEIHDHATENGTSRMVRVPDVSVPAGETLRFAPGGLHLMLIDIAAPLAAGASVTMALRFASAGTVVIDVPVLDARAGTPPAAAR